MVLVAIASVVVATVIRVAWLTPIFYTAAVFWAFFPAMKQHRHRLALVLVLRWAAAVFATTVVVGVFVPARMDAVTPFSQRITDGLRDWLTASGGPPVDYPYMLWGLAAFFVGSLVSGGLLGFLVASVALGEAALGTLFLFEHGKNVLQIVVVAIPLWQWSLFACGVLLLVPSASPLFDRFLGSEQVAEDKRLLRRYMVAGAGCLVLTLLLRFALGGVMHDLTVRWTAF